MTLTICIILLAALIFVPTLVAALCIRYGTEPDRPWPREHVSGDSPTQPQREAA